MKCRPEDTVHAIAQSRVVFLPYLLFSSLRLSCVSVVHDPMIPELTLAKVWQAQWFVPGPWRTTDGRSAHRPVSGAMVRRVRAGLRGRADRPGWAGDHRRGGDPSPRGGLAGARPSSRSGV